MSVAYMPAWRCPAMSHRWAGVVNVATIALLQDRAATDANRLSARFQGALNSRVRIEQAKGALAERAGIGMDEAFGRLRSYVRDHKAKLTDAADALVPRTLPASQVDVVRGGSV